MITDASQSVCVSSLGWVDKGSLWVFEVSGRKPTKVHLNDAQYLKLHPGDRDFFAVLHQLDGGRIDITVHNFRDPGAAVAGVVVGPTEQKAWGDPTAWSSVPAHYSGYHAGPYWSGPCVIRISDAQAVELQQLPWHSAEYDAMYQGIVGATEVPGRDLVVISIQRDSNPVLYDPVRQERVGRVSLADRGGNPSVCFARHSNSVWIDDYDTLLRLETGSWRTLASRRLQDAPGRTQQFIGSCWLTANEEVLVVSRPFSGDVLEVDAEDLRPVRASITGDQPIEAVSMADGSIVARDWKTGSLLTGSWD